MISLISTIATAQTTELTPDSSGNVVLSKDQVITLANYIKNIEEDNSYLKAKVEELEKNLESEREATKKIIDEANKLKESLKRPWFDRIIPWLNLVATGIIIVRIW